MTLFIETDSAYNLALQFLPTISCVVKRVQLWEWLYSQVGGYQNCVW